MEKNEYQEVKNQLETIVTAIVNSNNPKQELKNKENLCGKELKNANAKVTKSAPTITNYRSFKANLEDQYDTGTLFVRQFNKQVDGIILRFERRVKEINTDVIEEIDTNPDSITREAKSSQRLVATQINKRILDYKSVSEGLIDAWIDFHRFF